MPKLNEYLGSIISSVSNARVMADVQTVKLAEDYAKHDLLKHFSVPRMRIADVELSIPIAIESAQEELPGNVDIINNKQFNSVVYTEITKSLGRSSLPRAASKQVLSSVSKLTKNLETQLNKTKDLDKVKDFSQELSAEIEKVAVENNLVNNAYELNSASLGERLQQTAKMLIKQQSSPTKIGDLNVIAEAHLLRDQKPENIMQIKMKITEDGMEWQYADQSDGTQTRKLLPE